MAAKLWGVGGLQAAADPHAVARHSLTLRLKIDPPVRFQHTTPRKPMHSLSSEPLPTPIFHAL